MKDATEKLQCAFRKSLISWVCRSYGRGEATACSDIDVVVIFSELVMSDLERYKDLIGKMPYRKSLRLCLRQEQADKLGQSWPLSVLSWYDPLLWQHWLSAPACKQVWCPRAVLVGACSIYHMCVHNFLHEYDAQILRSLCKTSFFVMIAKHFYETGDFIKKKNLILYLSCMKKREASWVNFHFDRTSPDKDEFRELSEKLLMWSGELINAFGD